MRSAIGLVFIFIFLFNCGLPEKRKPKYIAGLRMYYGDKEDELYKEEPKKKEKQETKREVKREARREEIRAVITKLEGEVRMAIYDFNAKNVSDSTAKSVSNWIRTAMISGDFAVLERSQMEKIFKEHRFAMTGCIDSECAVKIGRMLSANKVLVGTVEKFGSKYIITGRLVDVEKGIAEFGHQADVNNYDDLYECAIGFADNILRKMVKSRE